MLLLQLSCVSSGLLPVDGLLIEQLHLPGGLGESTLVVTPDGRSLLIDVGNDRHDDEVREALLARTGRDSADLVLLTHLDADHFGGLDELDFERLIWRGEVDLDQADPGELRELQDLLGEHTVESLCDEAGCELPFTLDLGDEASLTVFAANGQLAGGASMDPEEEENDRSLMGRVQQGDFDYIFGGDAHRDLEDLVAAELPEDLLPAGSVDLLHMNHHGKSSSTSQAWVQRLLPEDGHTRHAVVGANRFYGSAPDEDALARLGQRLAGGCVWVTEPGALSDEHPQRVDLDASLTLRVLEGGDRYRLSSRDRDQERVLLEQDSTPR